VQTTPYYAVTFLSTFRQPRLGDKHACYGVVVVFAHCLEVFARRIPTVRGHYSRFLTKSPSLRQQTVSDFSRSGCLHARPDFSVDAYCRRLGRSVLTVRYTGESENHFRPAAATVKNARTRLAQLQTVGIHRKIDAPGTAPKHQRLL